VSRLASLLVQDGVVGVKPMEDALQRQAVFGGTLDTNLLEAGALDEARLSAYLSQSAGLPAADADRITGAAAERIPRSLAGQAIQHGAVPVALIDRTLEVLVTETVDRKRLDDLGLRAGHEIVPLVVPEVRHQEALELLWGVPMPPRLASLRDRLGARSRGTAEEEPKEAPEDDRAEAPIEAEPEVPFHIELPAFDPTPMVAEEAQVRFGEVAERDGVLEVFCRGLAAHFHFAALFMVHGDRADGKMMIRGPFADRSDIAQVSLSLTDESIFRTALLSHRACLADVHQDDEVLRMLAGLGHSVPPNALVVPLEIRGRVVCLAYCDDNVNRVPAEAEPVAAWLAEQAGLAFLRLILATKGASRPWSNPEVPPSPAPVTLRAQVAGGEATTRRTGSMPAQRPTGPIELLRRTGQWGPPHTTPLPAVGGPPAANRRPTGAARVVLDLGAVSAPEVAEEIVDRLEREDLTPQDTEYLRRGGEEVLAEIARRFPGRLKTDWRTRREPLPPAAQCGPLLAALAGWREALPQLVSLAQSDDVEKRFWATFLISERPFEDAWPTLVDRAFDEDPALRALATSGLRRFASQPGFRDALARLNVELESSEPGRQLLAAEAAGILRDPGAVPALIHHVGSDDATLAEAAHRALFLITRQDFGRKRRKWLSWYEHNQPRHQIEWLIDALGSKEEEVRRSAEEDLRLLTGKDFGYLDGSSRSGREHVQRLWIRWWQDWGRRAFGQREPS
jgi:hypothetical protein